VLHVACGDLAALRLNTAEKNYSATELECLAVVWRIRRMKNYLEGYAFTVIIDHQALRWLQKLELPTGRLGRWVFELQQYDFDVKYRRGVLNKVADALSRCPEVSATRKAKRCRCYDRIREETQQEPAKRPEYRIKEGRLYRYILHSLDFKERGSEEQWKLCVPTPLRQKVMTSYHNEPTAGHLGIAKTITRIAQGYCWPSMFRDIARHVRNCETCQSYKATQQKPAGKLATEVKRPWEQVSIDLVGPLPQSKRGHTWLLVMQGSFSKWVELVLLRKATTDAVTQAVTNSIILKEWVPLAQGAIAHQPDSTRKIDTIPDSAPTR